MTITISLAKHGLRPLVGWGPYDDFEVKRARKEFRCDHQGPGSRPLAGDCAGPVQPGDLYVRCRQSWLAWEPVNLDCLLAAGVLEKVVTDAPE